MAQSAQSTRHGLDRSDKSANVRPFDTILLPKSEFADPDRTLERAYAPAAALAEAWHVPIFAVGSPSEVNPEHSLMEGHIGRPIDRHYYQTESQSLEDAVVDAATRFPRPLVVMAAHGRGRIGYAMFGSTAEAVLRHSACPVLLIGPNCDPDWLPGTAPVGVALDGTDLSERATPLAARWARWFENPLRLLHIYEPPPVPTARIPRRVDVAMYGPAGELPTAMTAAPNAVTPEWDGYIAPPGQAYVAGQANLWHERGLDVTPVSRPGRNAATAISDYLADHPLNLLAMTSHGRAGLGRIIVGSTTMAVVHDAPCPVLASAPDAEDES